MFLFVLRCHESVFGAVLTTGCSPPEVGVSQLCMECDIQLCAVDGLWLFNVQKDCCVHSVCAVAQYGWRSGCGCCSFRSQSALVRFRVRRPALRRSCLPGCWRHMLRPPWRPLPTSRTWRSESRLLAEDLMRATVHTCTGLWCSALQVPCVCTRVPLFCSQASEVTCLLSFCVLFA